MDTIPNIAIFADHENVAIGVRDARYDKFDISLVLERLLEKGKVVVKKAYADWDRYKSYKRQMHEAAFELIEIPHISMSGKNSADIRMVVDALDMCYAKAHLDVFVLITGDSDFSPLVSKLRENAKVVIGIGVKNSTSDLLVDNCDEFIYYDDLVREKGGTRGGRGKRPAKPRPKAPARGKDSGKPAATAAAAAAKKPAAEATIKAPEAAAETPEEVSEDKQALREQALELVLDTVERLFRDRDDNLWGSMVKQTIKRKRPNFSESYHGYRSFNHLLENAQQLGLLDIQKDDKSGGYLITSFGPNA